MLLDNQSVRTADEIESRPAFSLSEPGVMWTVIDGELDLFAMRTADAQASGALRPLCHVTAGDAVFGIPGGHESGVTILARRQYGCTVVKRPRVVALGDLDPAAAITADAVSLVNKWIGVLAHAVSGALAPKNAVRLEPGVDVESDDEKRACVADRVVWIRHRAGSSSYLARPDLLLSPADPCYPLAPGGWIEAQPGTELSVLDSFTALRQDGWHGLDVFHDYAVTCLTTRLDEVDETERRRMRARDDSDLRSLRAALQDLASPLQRSGPDRPIADGPDSPLFRACQIVGGAIGVIVKPPAAMLRGQRIADPVAAIAQASGVRYRCVALKDDWWNVTREPLLVFRDVDKLALAVVPARRGYRVYDPRTNAAPEGLTPELARSFNPLGFMFYAPLPLTAQSVGKLLWFGLKGSRVELLTIAALSLASGLFMLVLPFVTGLIFDSLIPEARRTDLVTVCVLLVVIAVTTALFNLTRGFAVLRLQGQLALKFQAGVWDRLLSLPVPFFHDYAAGDLADRSMAVSQIRGVLSGSSIGAILSGVSSIFTLGLLVYLSPPLALIAVGLTVVAAAGTVAAGVLQLRYQREISKQVGLVTGMVLEFLTGIAKFRVAGAEHRAFVRWVTSFANQKRQDYSGRQVALGFAVFNSFYVVGCLAIFFGANSGWSASGHPLLSTGRFVSFVSGFTQFMVAVLALSTTVVSIMNVVPLFERVAPILRAAPEVTAQTSAGELTGRVEVDHLVFRYRPNAPLVLRDVSFRIEPGEYVAFVGPSGCGKSTLFRLLLGFETAESGAIYYDGKDLTGLDVRSVRQQIGVVLQSGTLLGGSILGNIAAGAAALSLNDAWEAVRLAGLEDDLKRMPMGLYTSVTEGGGGLSGGQRQRVLIARAIARKPRLLLFDEATSALDNRTQAIVSQSLKALNATRIVVAHRLSTIIEADRIFVLNQGEIVQEGSYAELLRAPGLFRELAERQLT